MIGSDVVFVIISSNILRVYENKIFIVPNREKSIKKEKKINYQTCDVVKNAIYKTEWYFEPLEGYKDDNSKTLI